MSTKRNKGIILDDRPCDDNDDRDKGPTQVYRLVKFSKECTDVRNSNRSKSKMSGCVVDESHGHVLVHPGQDNSCLSVNDMLDLMAVPKITELMGFQCFNYCFRFFPPLMFLRWTVDFWLIICEAILALLTDHNRLAYTSLQASNKTAAGDGKSGFKKPTCNSKERSEEPKMEFRPPRGDTKKARRTTTAAMVMCNGPRVSTPRISNLQNIEKNPIVNHSNGRHHAPLDQDKITTSVREELQVESPINDVTRQQTRLSQGFVNVVLCFRLLLLYLIMTCAIPGVRRIVIFLSHLSYLMHTLAGLDEFDDQEEKNHRVFLYKHLVRHLPAWLNKDIVPGNVRQIRPKEWLIGHVIVRGIRELSKYPCLRSTFLTNIATKSGSHSFIETAKAHVMHIQEESFVDLPSYLASDHEYEEPDDSDYIHSEDSSLEEDVSEECLEDEAVDLLVSFCEHSDKSTICKEIIKRNDCSQQDCPTKERTQQKIRQLMDLLKLQDQVRRQRNKTRPEVLLTEPAQKMLTREEPLVEPTMEDPMIEEQTLEDAMDGKMVKEPMTDQLTIDLPRQGEITHEPDSYEYQDYTFTHPVYERTSPAQGDE